MGETESFSYRDQLFNSGERTGVDLAIIHHPDTDLICNNSARLALYGGKLADEFSGGVPRDWPALPAKPAFRTGEIAGQGFVVKPRTSLSPESIAMVAKMEARGHLTEISARALTAQSDITNEFNLAPDINAAMDEEWLQKGARDRGFTGVSYAEPIMGVISHHEGKVTQSTVYERIDGWPLADARARAAFGIDEAAAVGVTDIIRLALARHGITPDDLTPAQVLVDAGKHLYLIDAEFYTKTDAK